MLLTRKQVELLRLVLMLVAWTCAVVVLGLWGKTSTFPNIPPIEPGAWVAIAVTVVTGLGALACHLWVSEAPEDR